MTKPIGKYFGLIILLVGLLSFHACRSNRNVAEETTNIKKPVGIILEHQITGTIFNQKISRPTGIAVDHAGDIYFLDSGNDRIIRLDSDYKPVREAGGYGTGEGLLITAQYLAIDNNLNLVVSDAGNQRLSVYDNHLNFAYLIELRDIDDPFKYGRPSGVMVTNFGEIWIGDPDNSRLILFNHLGQFDRFVGDEDSYSSLFRQPGDICRGLGTDFIVSDIEKGMLFIFDNLGLLKDEFGDDIFIKPTGLACDNNNRIWVIDSEAPAVYTLTYDGELLFSEGVYGSGTDYSFRAPTDIEILPDDKFIISDTGNDRLLIYKILYY